jgi:hypothetical protein
VIKSGDVILPPEWQALVAGELRTTYTFRCETQEKTCRLGTNQAAGKLGTQGFELRFCLPQLPETLRGLEKRN